MKFVYEYRTSDNVRHDGVISASNREAAYAALKAQGIKPGFMKDAPGVFNKVFGKGKRWIAIAVLAMSVVAAALVIRSDNQKIQTIVASESSPLPRHQIYGDPARMEEFARAHYRNLMPSDADAYLAHFAQPGSEVSLGTNDAVVIEALAKLAADGFLPGIELTEADRVHREAGELKRVVMSMRQEFQRYLSNGVGTPASYLRRLYLRQRRERDIYLMAQSDLGRTDDDAQWERINNSLRKIGLPTIPRSEEKFSERKDF